MDQYDSVIFNHLKWNRHWQHPQTETVRVHKKFRWSWSGWAWPCNDFYLDRPLLCSWYHLVFKWSSAASYTTKESYFLTFSSKSLFSKFPWSVEYQKISNHETKSWNIPKFTRFVTSCFLLKNDYFGLKIRNWKFLGIEPSYGFFEKCIRMMRFWTYGMILQQFKRTVIQIKHKIEILNWID